jgi:hypothetical protein
MIESVRGRLKIPPFVLSLFGTIQPGPLANLIRAAVRGETANAMALFRAFNCSFILIQPYKRVDRWPIRSQKRAFEVFRALDSITPERWGRTWTTEGGRLSSLRCYGAKVLRFMVDGLKCFLGVLQRNGSARRTLFRKYRSLCTPLALIFHWRYS